MADRIQKLSTPAAAAMSIGPRRRGLRFADRARATTTATVSGAPQPALSPDSPAVAYEAASATYCGAARIDWLVTCSLVPHPAYQIANKIAGRTITHRRRNGPSWATISATQAIRKATPTPELLSDQLMARAAQTSAAVVRRSSSTSAASPPATEPRKPI